MCSTRTAVINLLLPVLKPTAGLVQWTRHTNVKSQRLSCFLSLYNSVVPSIILQELEGDLVASLREVGRARPESLVAFLPLVLDKLLLLMVKPPTVAGLTLNVGQVQRKVKCVSESNCFLSGSIFCDGSCCESSVSPPEPQERQPRKKRPAHDLHCLPGANLSILLTFGLITLC